MRPCVEKVRVNSVKLTIAWFSGTTGRFGNSVRQDVPGNPDGGNISINLQIWWEYELFWRSRRFSGNSLDHVAFRVDMEVMMLRHPSITLLTNSSGGGVRALALERLLSWVERSVFHLHLN